MNKKYGVILADPPWSYDVNRRGGAANHYSTMSIDDICNMQVSEKANADCVLLMWCTWPMLKKGLRVMESWGFEYVTGMPWIKVSTIHKDLFNGEIWVKPRWGTGFWFRGASEFVMVGRIGNPRKPAAPPVGLLSNTTLHSKKVNNMHEYAQMLDGPYLELFARRTMPGWDVFGNEVKDSIEL